MKKFTFIISLLVILPTFSVENTVTTEKNCKADLEEKLAPLLKTLAVSESIELQEPKKSHMIAKRNAQFLYEYRGDKAFNVIKGSHNLGDVIVRSDCSVKIIDLYNE
jgi:hypothetical protein